VSLIEPYLRAPEKLQPSRLTPQMEAMDDNLDIAQINLTVHGQRGPTAPERDHHRVDRPHHPGRLDPHFERAGQRLRDPQLAVARRQRHHADRRPGRPDEDRRLVHAARRRRDRRALVPARRARAPRRQPQPCDDVRGSRGRGAPLLPEGRRPADLQGLRPDDDPDPGDAAADRRGHRVQVERRHPSRLANVEPRRLDRTAGRRADPPRRPAPPGLPEQRQRHREGRARDEDAAREPPGRPRRRRGAEACRARCSSSPS
jgi:hypothetical protein